MEDFAIIGFLLLDRKGHPRYSKSKFMTSASSYQCDGCPYVVMHVVGCTSVIHTLIWMEQIKHICSGMSGVCFKLDRTFTNGETLAIIH